MSGDVARDHDSATIVRHPDPASSDSTMASPDVAGDQGLTGATDPQQVRKSGRKMENGFSRKDCKIKKRKLKFSFSIFAGYDATK